MNGKVFGSAIALIVFALGCAAAPPTPALRPSGQGWNCNITTAGRGGLCERAQAACDPQRCARQESAQCFTSDYKDEPFQCFADQKMCEKVRGWQKADIDGYNQSVEKKVTISACGEWR